MKAIAIQDFGGRDKLQLVDLPVPEVSPHDILIRIKAAGVWFFNSPHVYP